MDYILCAVIEVWNVVKKRVLCLTLLFTMFGIGIVCGIVIRKPTTIQSFFIGQCDDYVSSALNDGIVKLFFKRFFDLFSYLLLAIPLIFTPFYMPIFVLIVFYKGYVFGSIIIFLFSAYGFSGILLFLIVVLPQILLFLLNFLSFACFSYDFGKEKQCRCGSVKSDYLSGIVVFLLFSFITSLFEVLCVVLIFRPLSHIF